MHARTAMLFTFVFAIVGPLCLPASAQAITIGDSLRQRLLEQKAAAHSDAFLAARQSSNPAMRALLDNRNLLFTHLDERNHPVFLTTHNLNAAKTISTDDVWPGGSAGLDLDGNGIDFLGVWDAGSVLDTHQEFAGRVIVHDPVATGDHATHVAGTMVAAGISAGAKGMAFSATLHDWDWEDDLLDMTQAATDGIRISNHSYGNITGWSQQGSSWYWFGDPGISETEDYHFGFYGEQARDLDLFCQANPQYLVVLAAGNDRDDAGPASPGTHFVWDGTDWVTSSFTRSRDGGTSGYDCLPSDKCSKNALVVGAVQDITGGYNGTPSVNSAPFSSWGPTDDGRVKPDLVANGVNVTSPLNSSNTSYAAYSGTSMAAPSVSGSAALLSQYYSERLGDYPNAATLKGLLIHTADPSNNRDGPDYMYGWGLMNTRSAAALVDLQSQDPWHIREEQLGNGQVVRLHFHADAFDRVGITLCWTDPAGTPVAPSLDPATPMLVHDLDARVKTSFGYTGYPWCLDGADPSAPAYRGDNTRDNVERFEFWFGDDEEFTLEISHKGTIAVQSYSLLITGATPSTCYTDQPVPPLVRLDVVEPDVLLSWDPVTASIDGCPVDSVMYDVYKSPGDSAAFQFQDSTAGSSYLDFGAAADAGSTRYQVIARTPGVSVPHLPALVAIPAGGFRRGQSGTNGPLLLWVDLTHDFLLSRTEITNWQYLKALNWAWENGLVTIEGDFVRQYGVDLLRIQGNDQDIYEIIFDGNTQRFGLHTATWMHTSPGSLRGPGEAYPAGYDPSHHPVVNVTWYGAACYCDWLSQMTGLAPYYNGNWSQIPSVYNPYLASGFRLPTEAEWEYAGRYNDERYYPWGVDWATCERANCAADGASSNSPCIGWSTLVGSYPIDQSELGLMDMAGNVTEWTNDWYATTSQYLAGPDPVGAPTVSSFGKIAKGANWDRAPLGCRLASRAYSSPVEQYYHYGFRICLIQDQEP